LSCEHISSCIFWISLWLFNDFNIFESVNPILLRLCLMDIIIVIEIIIIIVMMITDVRKMYRGWPHIRISAKIVQGTNYVRVKKCTTRRTHVMWDRAGGRLCETIVVKQNVRLATL
jgi:hypothetical protein